MVTTTASGCTSNPGKSILRMEWTEVVNGTNTRYVANYRWLSGTNTDSIVACLVLGHRVPGRWATPTPWPRPDR